MNKVEGLQLLEKLNTTRDNNSATPTRRVKAPQNIYEQIPLKENTRR